MQNPAHRVHMLEVGSLVGEYRIEKLVGQGGMGQVYGAIHPLIGKRAAIKVLRGELCSDAETIERFVLEARAVNQIGHPNIVDVFAFGALPDGRQYMVMEWLRGESLDQRIRRLLPTLEETCDIVLGICAALDAAHAEQIIHRDLKPHNVFLAHARGMKPTVKLLDFGLAKLVGNDGERVERTRSGSMLGTPAYMSPEQARGRGVDHRTDLYALGVMLFEMVTGMLPFLEASAMEMVVAHMQRPPPVPSSYRRDLPLALDELILGLLSKEPAHRPTIADVIVVISGIQRQLAAMPARPPPMNPTLIAADPPRGMTAPSIPSPVATSQASVRVAPPDAPTIRPFLSAPVTPNVASVPMHVMTAASSAPSPHASVASLHASNASHASMRVAPPDVPTIRPFLDASAASRPVAPYVVGAVSPQVAGYASAMPGATPQVAGYASAMPGAAAPIASSVSSSNVGNSALGSVAPSTQIAPRSSRGSRRTVLALVGFVVAAGIAFASVFAIKHGDESAPTGSPGASHGSAPAGLDAAASVVAPDGGIAVVPEPGTAIDAGAAVAIDAVGPGSAIGSAPRAPDPRSRDAGVGATSPGKPKSRDAGGANPPTGAGAANPPAPADAGVAPTPDAAKPVDDGDGLLPTRPGGRR